MAKTETPADSENLDRGSAPRGRPVPPTACNWSDMDKHSDVRPIPLFTIVLWKVLNVVAFGLELSLLPYRISSAGAAAPRGVGRWLQQDLTLQAWTNPPMFVQFLFPSLICGRSLMG